VVLALAGAGFLAAVPKLAASLGAFGEVGSARDEFVPVDGLLEDPALVVEDPDGLERWPALAVPVVLEVVFLDDASEDRRSAIVDGGRVFSGVPGARLAGAPGAVREVLFAAVEVAGFDAVDIALPVPVAVFRTVEVAPPVGLVGGFDMSGERVGAGVGAVVVEDGRAVPVGTRLGLPLTRDFLGASLWVSFTGPFEGEATAGAPACCSASTSPAMTIR
jgi:hypothetical protein